jgi:aryl-alcohol dehydrogenase-like predicted oxidoreductase
VTIDRVILGTAQVGMRYGIASGSCEPGRRRALGMLEHARAEGIRRIDTAPAYGEAETWIGDFLAACPNAFEVTTKLPPLPPQAGDDAIAEHVETALSGSLHRLRTERVECLLIHHAGDLATHGAALVAALERERRRGRVANLGLSAYVPAEAQYMLAYPSLTVLQHPLSLLDRRLREDRVWPALRQAGVCIEARSILLQGLLALDPDHETAHRLGAGQALAALRSCLEPAGGSPVEMGLPFVLAAGADAALIGVDSCEQLDALLASLAKAVPGPLLEEIRRLPIPAASLLDPRRWSA